MEKLYARQNKDGDGLIFEDTPTGKTVAIVKDERYLHIMAAAPEMLAALEAAAEYIGGQWANDMGNAPAHLRVIEDAIRKAKGE